MPVPILNSSATVLCAHGGKALPTVPSQRVTVAGFPIVTIASPYIVSGCGFTAGTGPCVNGRWLKGANRVVSQGQPIALATGQSVCEPSGTPLMAAVVESRAVAE